MSSVSAFVRAHPWIVVLLVLVCVTAAWLYTTALQESSYPEVEELAAGKELSFQEYSTYFRKLSEDKGAPYAYEILLRAEFPVGIDVHLLGHVIGDMLYKQQGIAGINVCTQDFRNACSHSVVIGILNDHGEGVLPEIAATCKEAPGGKGAYTMCFHGLGHGVLAYTGYNLERAVQMCKRTGTPEYQEREYIECVGGTIMEMIAGVHDPLAWQEQVGNYFKDNDPLYPCSAPFMPGEVRPICYAQLTPHLYTAAGIDLASIDTSKYEKAFSFCNALPQGSQERESCYGGFGKEFIVSARERDVRDIGSMEAPALAHVREWCTYANDADGEKACNGSALASLFWGAENKPDAAFTFCAIASGQEQQECHSQLSDQISFYLGGEYRGLLLCDRLPTALRESCRLRTL